MDNFIYSAPTKYIFGKDIEYEVGKEVLNYGKKILLHYGGGSIKRNGLYDKVVKSLNDYDVDFVELGGVESNPKLELVYKGVELCKKEEVEMILAVGGGSVIDSSKAIALGQHYDGDVWDFYIGKAVAEKATPVGTILTISAAGSEGSQGSVITKKEGAYKRPVNSEYLVPKFSMLNPMTTMSVPTYHTFAGITDILAHLMERYFTTTKGVDLTDRLIETTMKTVINNAEILLENPNDYNARAQVMWAGTIGHNSLFDTGRNSCWGSHDIEHEISGIYDISHGVGLAIIFPAWMKYVYKNDVDRFRQFAVRVFNVDQDFFDNERTALMGIKALEDFLVSIGMPIRFSDINIGDERIEEMAKKATEKHPVGNFVNLYERDVLEILKLAL